MRLIKLKFQDNLEFLQWIKKYWDTHFEGVCGEKRAIVTGAIVTNVKKATHLLSRSSSQIQRGQSISNTSIPNNHSNANPNTNTNANTNTAGSLAPQSNVNALQLAALTKTITELKLSVDEMEKERDFYFNKLRDIEILTQKITEPAVNSSLFFKQITEILYTTEDGFEIPQENKSDVMSGDSATA